MQGDALTMIEFIRFFIIYYPFVLAVVFLIALPVTHHPAKGLFFLRALLALGIAVLLAHLNRIFGFWPGHLSFFSGHMTFSLGVSLSLGMLHRWTLAVTLPLLIPLGWGLVWFHFHSVEDVVVAVPIVLVIYGLVHRLWRIPAPSLDRVKVST